MVHAHRHARCGCGMWTIFVYALVSAENLSHVLTAVCPLRLGRLPALVTHPFRSRRLTDTCTRHTPHARGIRRLWL